MTHNINSRSAEGRVGVSAVNIQVIVGASSLRATILIPLCTTEETRMRTTDGLGVPSRTVLVVIVRCLVLLSKTASEYWRDNSGLRVWSFFVGMGLCVFRVYVIGRELFVGRKPGRCLRPGGVSNWHFRVPFKSLPIRVTEELRYLVVGFGGVFHLLTCVLSHHTPGAGPKSLWCTVLSTTYRFSVPSRLSSNSVSHCGYCFMKSFVSLKWRRDVEHMASQRMESMFSKPSCRICSCCIVYADHFIELLLSEQ